MKRIYIVQMVLSDNGTTTHNMLAHASQKSAQVHEQECFSVLDRAKALNLQIEAKINAWTEANPYPSDAYEVYSSARADYREAQHNRLWQEYDCAELRGKILDGLTTKWEEDNIHLHQNTIQEAWRSGLCAHIDSLTENMSLKMVMMKFVSRVPECERYNPSRISFRTVECDMVIDSDPFYYPYPEG